MTDLDLLVLAAYGFADECPILHGWPRHWYAKRSPRPLCRAGWTGIRLARGVKTTELVTPADVLPAESRASWGWTTPAVQPPIRK